jgi:hypothetical protein
VTVRVSGFRFRVAAITGKGDAAGFVLYDRGTAAPRDVFVIALAGPVASLAAPIVGPERGDIDTASRPLGAGSHACRRARAPT